MRKRKGTFTSMCKCCVVLANRIPISLWSCYLPGLVWGCCRTPWEGCWGGRSRWRCCPRSGSEEAENRRLWCRRPSEGCSGWSVWYSTLWQPSQKDWKKVKFYSTGCESEKGNKFWGVIFPLKKVLWDYFLVPMESLVYVFLWIVLHFFKCINNL